MLLPFPVSEVLNLDKGRFPLPERLAYPMRIPIAEG